ncbi:MAG: hypothetical protein OXU54_02475 [Gammaproteobacteria bacterium]|nr:hypothetical protein [Gammaproteobacteria bacterium]
MNIRAAGLGLESASGAVTGRDVAGNGAGNPVMPPAILWGGGTIPARAGRFAPGAGWRRGGALAVALCLGAGLGGCGGGGGGGGGSSMASGLASPTQAQIRAVAETEPLFGSVTQSSQSSSGITQGSTMVSDGAEDTATVTVTVTGQGLTDDRIAANLVSDRVGERVFRNGEALFRDALGTVAHPQGRDISYRVLVRGNVNDDGVVGSEGGALGVSLLTDRFDASAGDEYLTFGAWVYVPNGANVAGGASVLGVFSDGVETPRPSETLPTSGSATYSGHTFGWAVTNFGDEVLNVGQMFGVVTLNANFDTNMVSGMIRDLRFDLSGLASDFDGDYTQRKTTVTLGAASVDDDGTFQGRVTGIADDTSIIPLEERFHYRVMDDRDRWGGRFFGNDGARTAPPAIGGTWGVSATATRADGMPGSANLDVAGGFGAWKD